MEDVREQRLNSSLASESSAAVYNEHCVQHRQEAPGVVSLFKALCSRNEMFFIILSSGELLYVIV